MLIPDWRKRRPAAASPHNNNRASPLGNKRTGNMAEIILDPSIRDWVVLPMVIIFGCSAMVRHYITLLLKTEKMAAVEELRPM